MLRGGSWYTLPRPQPQTRTFGGADERNGFYGFRPARSL
jgi:formylglycine-generating enzyme required for sulfatase activity